MYHSECNVLVRGIKIQIRLSDSSVKRNGPLRKITRQSAPQKF